jgi:hypothetical protein
MTEPSKHDASGAQVPAGTGGDDRRIDALLNEGLDAYFDARFEDAIHLWTRVLFLDRHHASARAYIERARGALAERQRRADEALQGVVRLIDAGRLSDARTQLGLVVDAVGDDERTAAVRMRLDRLERLAPGSLPRIHPVAADAAPWWGAGLAVLNHRVRPTHAAVAATLLLASMVALSPGVRSWLGFRAERSVPVVAPVSVSVQTLSSGEVALTRARALYSRGRLAEALATLDRVGTEQIERTEADRLRVEIQRVLLAAADDQARRGVR